MPRQTNQSEELPPYTPTATPPTNDAAPPEYSNLQPAAVHQRQGRAPAPATPRASGAAGSPTNRGRSKDRNSTVPGKTPKPPNKKGSPSRERSTSAGPSGLRTSAVNEPPDFLAYMREPTSENEWALRYTKGKGKGPATAPVGKLPEHGLAMKQYNERFDTINENRDPPIVFGVASWRDDKTVKVGICINGHFINRDMKTGVAITKPIDVRYKLRTLNDYKTLVETGVVETEYRVVELGGLALADADKVLRWMCWRVDFWPALIKNAETAAEKSRQASREASDLIHSITAHASAARPKWSIGKGKGKANAALAVETEKLTKANDQHEIDLGKVEEYRRDSELYEGEKFTKRKPFSVDPLLFCRQFVAEARKYANKDEDWRKHSARLKRHTQLPLTMTKTDEKEEKKKMVQWEAESQQAIKNGDEDFELF